MRRAKQGAHLDAEVLEAMAAGRRPVAEVALQALEHLGGERDAVCPRCRESLRPYPPGRIAERAGGSYTAVLARNVARVEDLAAEYRAAGALLDELAGESDLGRAVARLMSPRFATFGFCLTLMDEAAAAMPERPETGWKLALLAVVVAERVDRHRYRERTLQDDLLCASRAKLVDGLLATGHVEEAEEELLLAEEARRRGSGDRYYRAELDLVRCRLLLARGRPEEVREVAYGVEEWAMREGAGREDFVWEAIRVGAEAAVALEEPIQAADELHVLAAALRGKVYWVREQRVRLELVGALAQAERYDDAWSELCKIRILSDASESPVGLAREAFWEGVLHGRLGRVEEAIGALERARGTFVREGLGLEALRASLHLLTLLTEPGREEAFGASVEELPDLLTVDGLPGWAGAHLVWVLREMSEEAAGGAVVGEVVLEALIRGGGKSKPPERLQ